MCSCTVALVCAASASAAVFALLHLPVRSQPFNSIVIVARPTILHHQQQRRRQQRHFLNIRCDPTLPFLSFALLNHIDPGTAADSCYFSLSQFLRQRRTTKERGVTSGTKCAGSATFRSEGRLKHTTTITTTQPAKLPTISLSSSFASPEPNFSTTTTTAVCDIVISSQRPNTTTATMNLT